jgi:hypothetical protein
MFKGRGAFEWSMTSSILALTVNMNRKPGTAAVDPSRFNPFAEKEKEVVKLDSKQTMSILKSVFVKS